MDNALHTDRILSHGYIEPELLFTNTGDYIFSLGGAPFSIFIYPKNDTLMGKIMLVNCLLLHEDESHQFSNIPVKIGEWAPYEIVGLNLRDISKYYFAIFWGSTEYISEDQFWEAYGNDHPDRFIEFETVTDQ